MGPGQGRCERRAPLLPLASPSSAGRAAWRWRAGPALHHVRAEDGSAESRRPSQRRRGLGGASPNGAPVHSAPALDPGMGACV